MHFTKMHGIGNDYVYVNAFREVVAQPEVLAPRIAERHFGVGGDGLILVMPPDPGVDAHVRMRMFNADGSESEMCGNGVRCVCKLAHDQDITAANPMRVQTGRGVLTLSYTTDGDGKVAQVTVDMGEPILAADDIPVDLPRHHPSPLVDLPLFQYIPGEGPADWKAECGLDERMTCVSMGNPHMVIYCRQVAAVPLASIGPFLERQPIFPRRINAHFVQVDAPGEVTMRTWERGSGITLACGTGASAVCVAGVLSGRTQRRILAHLPGGDLTLQWHEATNHVEMTGPAVEVFQGEWPEM
ncbi:MAG: diaminopimelate epimerase [Phycisphaeraceae bacterium]